MSSEGENAQEQIARRITDLIAELHRLYDSDDGDNGILEQLEAAHRALSREGAYTGSGAAVAAPGIVASDSKPSLRERLVGHTSGSKVVRIASAFVTAGEHNPLILPLREMTRRGNSVYLLTSIMHLFNRPETLEEFSRWGNVNIRLYVRDPQVSVGRVLTEQAAFHAKTYLFEKENAPNVVVAGSANMTGAGVGTNVEWSYVSDFEVNAPLGEDARTPYASAVELFDSTWETHGYQVTEEFLSEYRKVWRPPRRGISLAGLDGPVGVDEPTGPDLPDIAPRPAQREALEELQRIRAEGRRRFAVVAATGIGKTFLSAFDVRNLAAEEPPVQRVLFLAHRAHILEHAKQTFARVLPTWKGYVVQGAQSVGAVPEKPCTVFATVQTLSRKANLRHFEPDAFDYIIIDEFHHAAADSYRAVLDYFTPTYLLGMTATPERIDGQDVLEICNRNIAYEVRLLDAVERGWLVPFQYYAIYDPTKYEQITWNGTGYDEAELEKALEDDTRADVIASNLKLYQPATGSWKCIAFCSNTGHAKWMAKAFTERDFMAETITAETKEEKRTELLNRLRSDEDELSVICSVDVLTEGVDVPGLTHVLLLRPTQSFRVFLQQLGRGLRLDEGKSFLVVLDFVGNFRNNYVAPLALHGYSQLPTTEEQINVLKQAFTQPSGCYIGVDTRVREVQQEELEERIRQAGPLQQIRALITQAAIEKHAESGMANVGEEDFLESDTKPADPKAVHLPEVFYLEDAARFRKRLRKLGGWLKVRVDLELAGDYEQELLGTDGEAFLKHIESELKPNKSYKMAVLHGLLDMADEGNTSAEWAIDDIAERFRAYYEQHPHLMSDWPELNRYEHPSDLPMSKVRAELLKNPLKYLSHPDDKFFALPEDTDRFRLKPPIDALWPDPRFRQLVRERVEYAEACYWRSKGTFSDRTQGEKSE